LGEIEKRPFWDSDLKAIEVEIIKLVSLEIKLRLSFGIALSCFILA